MCFGCTIQIFVCQLCFGAPEAACKIISTIGLVEFVPTFLDEVSRTYKIVDLRLAPIKDMLVELDVESNLRLVIAREVNRIASSFGFFSKRGLHASAVCYAAFVFITM